MITRRQAALACGAAIIGAARKTEASAPAGPHIMRVPAGGLQPQVAADPEGGIHLLYYTGDLHHGDLFYATSKDGSKFSAAVRVNSQPGSAIASGSIRGGQLALG